MGDDDGFSPQAYYNILDACLTDILDKGGAEITPAVDRHLIDFNRILRRALGLPRPGH
jgi:hypothetical protein